MGLGVEIYKPMIIGPGLHIDGEWYPGDGAVEVGASMAASGWATEVEGNTLRVSKADSARSITFHAASPTRPSARDRPTP